MIFFQPDMPIDRDEFAKFLWRHLIVSLLGGTISALDTVHCYATWSQHSFHLLEDGVFVFRRYVAQHVQTHNVIETCVGEGKIREFSFAGKIVPIPACGCCALL